MHEGRGGEVAERGRRVRVGLADDRPRFGLGRARVGVGVASDARDGAEAEHLTAGAGAR